MFNKIKSQKNYIQWIRKKVGHEKIILVHAGGCIFNEQGEVLLQRRVDCNMWGFPGGALELGETPEMAAVREVKEETGYDVILESIIPFGEIEEKTKQQFMVSFTTSRMLNPLKITKELFHFPNMLTTTNTYGVWQTAKRD